MFGPARSTCDTWMEIHDALERGRCAGASKFDVPSAEKL